MIDRIIMLLSVSGLISRTQLKIHQSIIPVENDNFKEIERLQSDYLKISSDFSNSYYNLTKDHKPSQKIDKEITQYIITIRQELEDTNIITAEGYRIAFSNLFHKLHDFAKSISQLNLR